MIICPCSSFICEQIISPPQTDPSSLVLVYDKGEFDTRSLPCTIHSSMVGLEACRLTKSLGEFRLLLLSDTIRTLLGCVGQVLSEGLFGGVKLETGDAGSESPNCGASPENGP